jgi:LacI family transcriptional regulator
MPPRSTQARRSTPRIINPGDRPRVGLLVSAWNEYGRGIIEGVWQYAERHGQWLLEMQPNLPDGSTEIPAGWAVDGVIGQVQTSRLAARLRETGVPVVNVSGSRRQGIDFPRVTSDAEAVARMAVTHLREKGLKHIAFCGEPHRPFLDFWTVAYRKAAVAAGLQPLIYQPAAGFENPAGIEALQQDRRRWIESLPKPVGIIGWDTTTCRHLSTICSVSGIKVPDHAAIISLETEDLLGRTLHPPLSGVDIPVTQIGHQAAAMLDSLLRGLTPEPREILLEPLGVTARQSTDVAACEDPHVIRTLRFIRDHAHEGIDVRDVLKAVPIARRSLERRFMELLGRSPAEEIRRVKIDRVRRMLDSTDLPILDIAMSCGFNYMEHMIPVFKKHHGCTPSQYRKNARQGGPPRST